MHNTGAAVRLSIGELSRLTGVPVRTIRFYCDEGVIDSRRSSGGHRVFDAEAVESLFVVRRLRALGVGLPVITDVLSARVSVDEALNTERVAIERELDAVRRRRASLLAVVSTVRDGQRAHNDLIEFWREIFAGAISAESFDGFVAMSVPAPPEEPAPARVLAYAELAALARRPALNTRMSQQLWRFEPTHIADRRGLVNGVAEACELALPFVTDGRSPAAGPAVDRFVAAHAGARRERDTPEFRRALGANAGADDDPRIRRYWNLVGEISGAATTVGALQRWLYHALLK